MAPQIRKPKSAFLFYQGDQLSSIRKELNVSMGEAMTALSARWKALSDADRKKYFELEAEDRRRFEEESAKADEERLALQEERRNALVVQDGEDFRSRGARVKLDEERRQKEEERERRRQEREAEMDPEERAERDRQRELKRQEAEERQRKRDAEEQALKSQHKKLDKEQQKKAAARLEYLFKQSPIFAKLKMGSGSMNDGPEDEKKQAEDAATAAAKKRGVHHIHGKESEEEDIEEDEDGDQHVFLTKQPDCIKFGQLKGYQLESLNWMIHLAEKGLNGILADEMGLGKTLQSIAILAYHWEYLRIQGPHLICVPKSTLSNWMNELARWCPSLRAIKFHGSREDREEMAAQYFHNEAAAHDGKRPDRQVMNEKGELVDDNSENPRQWDVCVTTYEVCNMERNVLGKFAWKYLIIDEAHRLKNDASLFSTTVRNFRTSNRLLLTGTPLQNNLRELWALLNFLLPDIFASGDQFEEWFDLDIDDEDAKKNMISQLHKILRPFMLRRLKADVAKGLPPKTETIIMVGMSKMQKQVYKKLLLRDLDSIAGDNAGKTNRTAVLNIVMQLRKCCGHPYLFEGVEDRTLDPLGEHLVENCGKLYMLDKLLKKLKERGSRCLIFTQMTRVLDIMEDFMVMRQYKYCRIDGNTTYDDRESSIDAFNAPNSDIFCFILSTRAGGLGINLQTADTCILYDSDWNPQQDLQAQDRCHRLGQKKPVNVYRLVSENTIEEKIVERAQQKLKLDAMVVQQGRLKEKDKVSKEEIMAAVRFGADTVFRSEESTITDEDIDVILERGKAKTKEMAERLQKAEKGDLLDFRLDGGIATQTFEGVDYSDKELRNQLRLLAANSIGKRERRPPPASYNPIMVTKKSMVVNDVKIKLPKSLRLPQMEDHQFYNRERLEELGKLEFETYATLREKGKLPPREYIEKSRTLLPDEIGEEKLELLDEGFGDWTRTQYFQFVKSCAKFGRDDIAAIANDMDMDVEKIAPYSEAFWKYGPTELKHEWERNMKLIEAGEKKIAKQKKHTALLKKFVAAFDNPREEMIFENKGTTHFALEQDRALLCAVDKCGYGNWDTIREEIRRDTNLKFQHSVQGMTTAMIAKRCDYRMRQMERELNARERALKNKRPPTVIAAQKAIDAIKVMEDWDVDARKAQLSGDDPPPLNQVDSETAQLVKERLAEREQCVSRLREIEGQYARAMLTAEETRQAIIDSAQYVNFSNITLKPPVPNENVPEELETGEIEAIISQEILKTPECGQCANCIETGTVRKLCENRLAVRRKLVKEQIKKFMENPRKKKRPAPATAENGDAPHAKKRKKPGPKPGSNALGNKPMDIPDELFPEFCRMIGAYGTTERAKIISTFIERHAGISNRQVTIRINEITTREQPPCVPTPEPKKGLKGRSYMMFLRPRFYKYLLPQDRPIGWEQYAAEDDIKWEQEQKEANAAKEAAKLNKGGESLKSFDAASSLATASLGSNGDREEMASTASSPASKMDESKG